MQRENHGSVKLADLVRERLPTELARELDHAEIEVKEVELRVGLDSLLIRLSPRSVRAVKRATLIMATGLLTSLGWKVGTAHEVSGGSTPSRSPTVTCAVPK